LYLHNVDTCFYTMSLHALHLDEKQSLLDTLIYK